MSDRGSELDLKNSKNLQNFKSILFIAAGAAVAMVIFFLLLKSGYIGLSSESELRARMEEQDRLAKVNDSSSSLEVDQLVVTRPVIEQETLEPKLRDRAETKEEQPAVLMPPVRRPEPEEETQETIVESEPETDPRIAEMLAELMANSNTTTLEIDPNIPQPAQVTVESEAQPAEEKPLTPQEIKAARVSSAQFSGSGSSSGSRSEEDNETAALDPRQGNIDLRATKIELAVASKMRNPSFVVPAGTFIPCILVTMINNDAVGMIKCQVSRNVYGADGSIVLIDKGSEVLGEYKNGDLQPGASRMFVIWSRIRTPDNITIDINSPAGGDLGEAGVDGYVKRYFWRRFSNAIMFSLLIDGTNKLSGSKASGGGSTSSNIGGAAGKQANQSANFVSQELKNMMADYVNIKPTLIKNQGERINIILARDLDFKRSYSLRGNY